MQINVKFHTTKSLEIPFNYNYQLQSALLAMLRKVGKSDFWHDKGFGDLTKFKGFCFGALEGKYQIDKENKKLCFDKNVYLEIRSSVFDFIDSFQRAVECSPKIQLFDTELEIVEASLANRHLKSGNAVFNAVTPVVIHSKLDDGHTHFYSPDEIEFYIRLIENTEKKYYAITGEKPDGMILKSFGDCKKNVTSYKSTWITGYTCKFELETSLKMAEFIYNTGLGEKNSEGVGFLRIEGE